MAGLIEWHNCGMARAGSPTHVVPIEAVIGAAPKKTGVLGGVHCEEQGVIGTAECAGNWLRGEVLCGRVQQRKADGPGCAIVGGDGHFKREPIGHATASAEKA